MNVEKGQEVEKNVKILETKVVELASNLKRTSNNLPSTSACPNLVKSCKECDQKFSMNFELEIHMVTVHGLEKQHSCELCGKRFFHKWRLKKHASVHEKSTKPCKYFVTGNTCPFDDVGCKFLHAKSEETSVRDSDNDDNNEEGFGAGPNLVNLVND